MKEMSTGRKSILLFVLMIPFLVPIESIAQSNFYAAFKPGAYFPRSSDLNGFDTGFSGGFSFGYQFNPHFAAELGLGYFFTEGEKTIGAGSSARQQHYDVDVWPFTLTLKGILPFGKWDFFGLAGGGIYSVSVPYNGNGYYHYSYPYYYNDYDYIWGGYLGAGVQYNITKRFFLGVEGKYLWTEEAKFSGVNGFKLDGIISNAVLGFRF
jgi:opacity protein-like surface antigen